MNAEIISIGSELLLGQIVNTDAQYISQELSSLGIDVYYHTVVGDNKKRLVEAISIASKRSDIIITTGGLGPTIDDLSKETVAEYLGLELVLHKPSLARIEEYFNSTSRIMTNNNIKQAMFPKEAIILENNYGTAPGAIIEDDKIYIILPGPPHELKPMFNDYVLPYLKNMSSDKIYSKTLKIFGIGESEIEEGIKDLLVKQSNPTIAPLASSGEVKLRLTAKASSEDEAKNLIAPIQSEIKNRFGDALYGYDEDTIEKIVVSELKKKKMTIAIAESCSGGRISDLITNISGASDVFLQSCVTYTNKAKVQRLNVHPQTINHYGAVSYQTAEEMAKGIRESAGSDFGLAITGIAGPGGGTKEKPVGLVYIATADKHSVDLHECHFAGDRNQIKLRTSLFALNLIRLKLLNY